MTAQIHPCHSGPCQVLKLHSTSRSTLDLIGGQCCFLLCSNWQDPGSHRLVHIEDTVALELKSLLPWIYNLQELSGLAIPLEALACARLVWTQVVCEIAKIMKDPLGLLATLEGPLAVALFLKVLYLLRPPHLSRFWSQRTCSHAEDFIFCYGQKHERYCYHMISFCLEFLAWKVGDITTILGFFVLRFNHKALWELRWEAISFLCSEVYWICNQSPCRPRIALK